MPSFNKTYKLPFKFNIPNDTQSYLQKKSLLARFIKFIKRYLYIVLKGQKNLEILNIQSKHKNILWINLSAPSLGDSLMDLSSRIMIADKYVDLFTHINNAHIYTDDHIFNHIYTKITDVDKFKYDLVIIDSYSSRSINIKSKIASKTSYVGMFGYFNGPEVNQVYGPYITTNSTAFYIKVSEWITGVNVSDQQKTDNWESVKNEMIEAQALKKYSSYVSTLMHDKKIKYDENNFKFLQD